MLRRSFMMALCLMAGSLLSHSAIAQISATTIPQQNLIKPAELNQILQGTDKPPLIVQVGPKMMYAQAHIRGSIFAGPGSQPAGLQALDSALAGHSKSDFIVLYCGCCPWGRCPNVGPAFQHVKTLGYTNVKVLYIPNNFGDDWVSKGYPTDH